MKIIGVTGKSGAGKTEFSKYLSEKDSVGVVHADDLLNIVKKRYFGFFLQSKDEGKENLSAESPKIKSGAKKFFYSNRILFSMLMQFRSSIIKRSMLDAIEDFRKAGKEMVIIDDWSLNTHRYLKNKLDTIYVIRRPYLSRRTALRDREDLSVKEAKIWDIPFALNFYKIPEGDNVTVLNNEGTLEEWHKQAQQVYEKYHVKTFDEKYVCNADDRALDIDSKDIVRRKLEKLSRQELDRIREE